MKKVNIELTPFHSLILVKLFIEIESTGTVSPVCKDAIDAFSEQLSGKISEEDIKEVMLETEVQQIIGRCPRPE